MVCHPAGQVIVPRRREWHLAILWTSYNILCLGYCFGNTTTGSGDNQLLGGALLTVGFVFYPIVVPIVVSLRRRRAKPRGLGECTAPARIEALSS